MEEGSKRVHCPSGRPFLGEGAQMLNIDLYLFIPFIKTTLSKSMFKMQSS